MPKPRAIFVMPYVIAQELLTRSDLGRTPEPMVMDQPVGVAAFHEAGKVEGSNMPMYELCARAMSRLLPQGGCALDLGSGSGRYLAHLARHRPDVRIVGLDLSDTMLATGRRLLDEEGLADRISLLEADITAFAAEVPQVDVISSIWALHHLPSIEQLDSCLARIAGAREEHGCAVFLADFARFKNPRSFPMMLSAISGFPPALKPDGVASERAAWSLSELTNALERAGLGDLHHSLASPLPILQIHWARLGARVTAATSTSGARWNLLVASASTRSSSGAPSSSCPSVAAGGWWAKGGSALSRRAKCESDAAAIKGAPPPPLSMRRSTPASSCALRDGRQWSSLGPVVGPLTAVA